MITTDRAYFIGAHVRQPVKDALRSWSKQKSRSMSVFIAEAIEERLRAEGVEITEEPVDVGPTIAV